MGIYQQLRATRAVKRPWSGSIRGSEYVLIVLSEQGDCPIPSVNPSHKPRRRLTEKPPVEIGQLGVQPDQNENPCKQDNEVRELFHVTHVYTASKFTPPTLWVVFSSRQGGQVAEADNHIFSSSQVAGRKTRDCQPNRTAVGPQLLGPQPTPRKKPSTESHLSCHAAHKAYCSSSSLATLGRRRG
jgi:hypothetical protein